VKNRVAAMEAPPAHAAAAAATAAPLPAH